MQNIEPYGNEAFWEKRYKKTDVFSKDELYVDFDDLDQVLGLFLKDEDKTSKILHIGCGMSTLAQGLWKRVSLFLLSCYLFMLC